MRKSDEAFDAGQILSATLLEAGVTFYQFDAGDLTFESLQHLADRLKQRAQICQQDRDRLEEVRVTSVGQGAGHFDWPEQIQAHDGTCWHLVEPGIYRPES